MSLSSFQKALGIRNPVNQGTTFTPRPALSKPSPKFKPTKPAISKSERERERIIDNAEKQRKLWERYQCIRSERLLRIKTSHKGARKFLRTLELLSGEAECVGHGDCDVDVAGLASECGVHLLPDAYDKLTIAEEVASWIAGLAKRRGLPKADYDALQPVFGDDRETTMTELKEVLKLR